MLTYSRMVEITSLVDAWNAKGMFLVNHGELDPAYEMDEEYLAIMRRAATELELDFEELKEWDNQSRAEIEKFLREHSQQ